MSAGSGKPKATKRIGKPTGKLRHPVVSVATVIFSSPGRFRTVASVTALFLSPVIALAQLDYNGGLLSQDFNSLPQFGTYILPGKGPYNLSATPFNAPGTEGWSIFQNSGSPLKFSPGAGTISTSSFYAFGGAGSGDRALGHISSSGRIGRAGLILRNTTGQAISDFAVTYAGEQWRNGGSGNPNEVKFYYRVNAVFTDLTTTAGFTEVTALKFTSPVSSAVAGSLNGSHPANRSDLSATVSGINWPQGEFLTLRWQDLDESGSDDGLAIDDVLFYASPSATAPVVVDRQPENNAPIVMPATNIVVTFDQPVTATGAWFELTGSTSGPLAGAASGGPLRFIITPDFPLPSGEQIAVRIVAIQVTNAFAVPMATDHNFSFGVLPPPTTITKIHAVQGSDGVSPVQGADVTLEGVVVADFQGASPALGGFFIQEEDGDVDADPATSEGIFIFDRGMALPVAVNIGDLVRVTGPVAEFDCLTEIAMPAAVTVLGSAALPSPAAISLPVPFQGYKERFEGMRVSFPLTLTVTGTESLGRLGWLELSSGGPLESPTESIDPNDSPSSGTASTGNSNVAAVIAEMDLNSRRTLVLDDSAAGLYPDPTPFLNGQQTRRCGDTIENLAGVLSCGDGAFRVLPTAAVLFSDTNPRLPAPPVPGNRLRVVSMNVLNYFTTFGSRGASNAAEFTRQKDKIVAALTALDADVFGLIELENNGATALADLVGALNASLGSTVYTAVADPPAGSGGDAIRTAFIFRSSNVTPIGQAILDTDPIWGGANPLRPPLAQLFEGNTSANRFIVCVNHLKSKSSTGAAGLDLDQGDGQGAYNDTRRTLMARLIAFAGEVQASTSESDFLIIGDLNAYGEEDPIDLLRAGGWLDQLDAFELGGYSYRFGAERGHLDHVFASLTMADRIASAGHWAINADEPAYYDYNTESKSVAQLAINAGGPFRSSDHDPVIVDVFDFPLVTFADWQAAISWPAGADSSAAGNPNANRFTNLAEFVFNLDPVGNTSHYPGPSAAFSGTENIRLDYRLHNRAADVTVTPQWSENLTDWFPMDAPAKIATIDPVTDLMRATIPYEGKAALFVRISITLD